MNNVVNITRAADRLAVKNREAWERLQPFINMIQDVRKGNRTAKEQETVQAQRKGKFLWLNNT